MRRFQHIRVNDTAPRVSVPVPCTHRRSPLSSKIFFSALLVSVVVIATLFISPRSVKAATLVPPGNTGDDVLWTKAESPYVITGSTSFSGTLTIDPGVVVKFNAPDARLYLLGALDARGTADGPIIFTSIHDDTAGGDSNNNGNTTRPRVADTGEITLTGVGPHELSHVEVRYIYPGIIVQGAEAVSATHLVMDSTFGSPFIFDESTVTFTDVTFREATEGFVISDSHVDINDISFVDGIGNPFAFSNNADVTLRNVTFSDFAAGTAFSLRSGAQADVENVVVQGMVLGDLFGIYGQSFLRVEGGILTSSAYIDGDVAGLYGGSELLLNKFRINDNVFVDGDFLGLYQTSSTTITNMVVADTTVFNRDFIGLYHGSTLSLFNADVAGFIDSTFLGLYGSFADVASTTFTGTSDYGIFLFDSAGVDPTLSLSATSLRGARYTGIGAYAGSLSMHDSSISGSEVGIDAYDGGDTPTSVEITNSAIYDNTDYGLYADGKEAPLVDARNNYWGDASGPFHASENPGGLGNEVTDGVFFSPWLEYDPTLPPPEPTCCSSVLFLPGLQASRLYVQGTFFENQLWEPNRTLDVETLYLDEQGNSITTGVYARDIIDEALGFNIYKNFIAFMDGLADPDTGIIEEWRSFEYDWRYDVRDVLTGGVSVRNNSGEFEVKNVVDELVALADGSRTGKVTIIAHSNGGLLGKLLISELEAQGRADLVDRFIMVAVPQLGTPSALTGLLHGEELALPKKFGVIMSETEARTLGENMKSAYALLPSQKYFTRVSTPVIEFGDDVGDIYDFQTIYGNFIDTKEGLSTFLLGDNGLRIEPENGDKDTPNVLDADMLAGAGELQDILDNWTAPIGVDVVQVVGWGLDTIRGISYDDCDIIFCPDELSNLDRKLIFVEDGDGTVVTPSADVLDVSETYYLNLLAHNNEILGGFRRNREHADILEVAPLQELLRVVIEDSSGFLPEHVTITKPIPDDEDNRIRVRIHSPVELHIYDTEGNHTGIVPNTDPTSDLRRFEAQIPNSYYREFGEVKYAGTSNLTDTTISLVGEGTGTFTLEVDTLSGTGTPVTTTFSNIPVIAGAQAQVVVGEDTVVSSLTLDVDNDGTPDAEVTPGEEVALDDFVTILKAVIGSLDILERKQKHLGKILAKIEKELKKEDKCDSKKKQEKCEQKNANKIGRIADRLIKEIEKMTKGKKAELTKQEAEEIIELIKTITN